MGSIPNADLTLAVTLPLLSYSGCQIAQLSVSITISETNPAPDVEVEEVTAPDQMTSASSPAFDKAQFSIQIIDPVATPILASTTTGLESVLKNLEGFMKVADLVAEACINHIGHIWVKI